MADSVTFEIKGGKTRFTLLDKLKKSVKQPRVKVGFPKGLDVQYPNGMSVVEIAMINEYGAIIEHPGGTSYGFNIKNAAMASKIRFLKKGEGFAELGKTGAHTITIPARPFMATTIRERRKEVTNFQMAAMKYLIKNGGSIEVLLSRFAVKYVAYIQSTITKFDSPPNAPSTIAKKHDNNPLIDTGLMRSSVTFEVVD